MSKLLIEIEKCQWTLPSADEPEHPPGLSPSFLAVMALARKARPVESKLVHQSLLAVRGAMLSEIDYLTGGDSAEPVLKFLREEVARYSVLIDHWKPSGAGSASAEGIGGK